MLDTFLRALPYTLEGRSWAEGAGLAVQVEGPGGGRWSWRYDGDVWRTAVNEPDRATVVRFNDADGLWRLCTRVLTPTEAGRRAEVTGDGELAHRVLQIVSIVR